MNFKHILILSILAVLLSVSVNAIDLNTCDNLTVAGATYNLLNDVGQSDNCFRVQADDITFEGNGYNINGTGAFTKNAFFLSQFNTTIKNVNITNYDLGMSSSWVGTNPFVNLQNVSIDNAGSSHIVFTTLDHLEMDGVYVSNWDGTPSALKGIYISGIESYNLNDVSIAGTHGMKIYDNNGPTFTNNITNSNFSDSLDVGLEVNGQFANPGYLVIENATASNNSDTGLTIRDTDATLINTFFFDNAASENLFLGISTTNIIYRDEVDGNSVNTTFNFSASLEIIYENISTSPYNFTNLTIGLEETSPLFDLFNKSAQITFDLPGIDPYVIRRNGVICTDATTPSCDFVSNDANGITYNVSSWSNYSIEETEIPPNVTTNLVNGTIVLSNAENYIGQINLTHPYLYSINISTNISTVIYQTNITDPYSYDMDLDVSSYPEGNYTLTITAVALQGIDPDITQVNYTFQVFEYEIGVCNASLIYPILNISYFNEVNDDPISVDNGMSLTLTDGLITFLQSNLFVNESNSVLCTNLGPSILNYTWNGYGTFTLEKDDYVTRVYSIDSGDPISLSNNPTSNLSLFMIPINDSSTISYTWQTTNFGAIDGTMKVYRCNLDGSEDLIVSAPIISSSATANIQLYTQTYRYEVVIGGVVYTDPAGWSRCHVESETTLSFSVDVDDITIDQLIGLASIECNLYKSGTDEVTMEWGPNPELSSPDVQGCIRAYRTTVSGLTVIYDSCETSATYDTSVTIPSNGNEYTVDAYLKQGNNIIQCNEQLNFSASQTDGGFFGYSALIAIFFLLAAMVLLFAGDGEIQLIGLGVGLVTVWFLGILPVLFNIVVSALAILVIVIIIGRYTRK